MTDLNKIADKVRKLLALANNNSNAEEAASAAAMAAALLAEHNLTTAQVETAADNDARASNEFETRNWSREMCHALATLNFCKSWYRCERRGYDIVTFLGTQANVTTTTVMLDYLVQTADRLAKQRCTTELDRQHFLRGFSARVAERLDKLRRQRERGPTQTGAGNTLPVLASLYAQHSHANEAHFEKLYPNVKLSYGHSLGGSGAGYSAGYKAGGSVSLDPQVGRASGRKALR
jgi:hypothetical protein